VFLVAYPQLGLALAAVATVPVSIIAYFLGTRAGAAAGIAFSPIHILLLLLLGEPLSAALPGGTGPGSLMLVGVGVIVGRMADMGRQIHAQQSVLVAERETLHEWRSRYSALVMTLAAGSDVQESPPETLVDEMAADVPQFRRFIRLAIVVAGTFGALEVVLGILVPVPTYVVLGGQALTYALIAVITLRALDRQVPLVPLASFLAVGLMLTGMVGAMLVPTQSPVLALVPIVAAAISLWFVDGRPLRRLLVLSWLASVVITAIGEFAAPVGLFADPFDAAVRLAGIPVAIGLIMFLLAAHSARQHATLKALALRHRDASHAEIRYRSLFNGLPIGLYRTTPGGRVLDANPAMVQMLGFPSRDALLASQVSAVYVNEAERDAWCAEIERRGVVVAAELEMRRPDGTQLWIRDTARLIRGPNGEALYFEGAAEDITEPKRLQEMLRHQAFHDPLTGLANRRLFLERLEAAITRGKQSRSAPAVLFIDVDDFKVINDSLGHDVGDGVLRAMADRLTGDTRSTDLVARLAGDEFTVLLPNAGSPDRAARVAADLIARLAEPLRVSERDVIVNVSIGIAMATGYADEALGQADIAMYAAKRDGKARYAHYDRSMHEEAWRRLEVGAQLRGVARRGELVVHYQPITELATGTIIGLEALVRWNHPTLGLLPPSAFIDVAEKTGHVIEIDRFVLTTACQQLADWRRELGLERLSMNVNMSAVDVRDGTVLSVVRAALDAAKLEPSALCIEITESSLLADNAVTDRALSELRELGVRLAIDDFGAGFSNLGYLKRLPVDGLKIDRSLISGIPNAPRDEAILKAAVAFGSTLGLEVTLEGIETQAQYEAGIRVGADAAQGYFMSPPGPAEEIAPLLGLPTLAAAVAGGGR
jgi:diguanylate cyclase (GGDEF)-like protein/PAS domain S-box-containing protein